MFGSRSRQTALWWLVDLKVVEAEMYVINDCRCNIATSSVPSLYSIHKRAYRADELLYSAFVAVPVRPVYKRNREDKYR